MTTYEYFAEKAKKDSFYNEKIQDMLVSDLSLDIREFFIKHLRASFQRMEEFKKEKEYDLARFFEAVTKGYAKKLEEIGEKIDNVCTIGGVA